MQQSLYDLARKNVTDNGFASHVQVIHGNFVQTSAMLENDREKALDLLEQAREQGMTVAGRLPAWPGDDHFLLRHL